MISRIFDFDFFSWEFRIFSYIQNLSIWEIIVELKKVCSKNDSDVFQKKNIYILINLINFS